jgi:hypothetical protein
MARVERVPRQASDLRRGTVWQIIQSNNFIAMEIFNHHIIYIYTHAPVLCSPTWREEMEARLTCIAKDKNLTLVFFLAYTCHDISRRMS